MDCLLTDSRKDWIWLFSLLILDEKMNHVKTRKALTTPQCVPLAPDRQEVGSSCSWAASSPGSNPSPTSETRRELHLPHTAGTSWSDSAGQRSASSDRLLYTDDAEHIKHAHTAKSMLYNSCRTEGSRAEYKLTCSSLKSSRIIPPPSSSCLSV